MPEPNKWDLDYKERIGKRGWALGSEEKVKELFFEKLKLNNKVNHLVKGWFSDTLPIYKDDIGRIALLHLDCDWYESVKCCLKELWDSLVDKGAIVIDDYGHWKGCRKAVDEFIEEENLKVESAKTAYMENLLLLSAKVKSGGKRITLKLWMNPKRVDLAEIKKNFWRRAD